ncbi:RNA-directed DNA polymerase [Cohnella sp. 56]|uniref:RNA-directed DNA polymerase n=1 Tax=Cohnella sp. 56 TaxID=3113722 RepID=UPI0030EA06CC
MNIIYFNFLEQSYIIEHDMYFSMNYLLRYGYFDFKYSEQYEEDYIISKYVYKEIFNTDELSSAYYKIIDKVNFRTYVDTAPIELSIYKNEAERRTYKLPNIYSYISLCRHLEQNKSIYLKIISDSHQSLSKQFHAPFHKGKQRREENRLGKKHIMKTDIQNFYPSIYTHSIPWILVGKNEAKNNKTDKSKYYNELDSLIQRCQRGETHGIPTGSFASRLIAELYMCKLDEIMCSFSYVRYVDDFEFSYNDESEKGNFYKELSTELSKLNLKLKVEKNHIDSFPFQGDNNSAFFFDYFLNVADEKRQTKRIYNFIDSSIYKEREGYKGALKLMFKSLKSNIVDARISQQSLTRHIYKQLFNMVLMTPHLSVYFMEFINVLDEKVIDYTLRPSIIEMKTQIQNNINRYLELSYHQELYSLLSIFLFIGVNNVCTNEQLVNIITSMDDLSAILALELLVRDENNINNTLFESIECKLKNSFSWEEEYWLLKYHFFLKLNENKKFLKEYKNFIYHKYGTGIERSKFFNPQNLSSLNSPIILATQNQNSKADISTFFNTLFDNNVSFFIDPL